MKDLLIKGREIKPPMDSLLLIFYRNEWHVAKFIDSSLLGDGSELCFDLSPYGGDSLAYWDYKDIEYIELD